MSNTKKSVRNQAVVQCKQSSGVSEEVIFKQQDQRCFINVSICKAKAPATFSWTA
ncbi:hypothetical protein DPMN_069938 [Dreissena polymorpha]|uniref:Uncharacterized protein n=1 Tax=Dreissena polymorpha TaxID=45954 RepID=A0A9D3Z476_DREPO|nr:hypothetical protein DPMN_069938 [Dreissena polymorpha]